MTATQETPRHVVMLIAVLTWAFVRDRRFARDHREP
jgi:hypothetical protein